MTSSLGRRRRALREEERRLWDKVVESVTPLETRRPPIEGAAEPAPAEPLPPPTLPPVPPPVAAKPAAPRVATAPAGGEDDGVVERPSRRALAAWARSMRGDPRDAGDRAMSPRPPSLAPIDDRTRRRLVRGAMAIDERLDLHGMTQEAAHSALRRFLVGARDRGARMVLVITGKGKPGGSAFEQHERGVLRRSVPHWLADPSLRAVVVGFEEAHLAHGGAGAVYVRLRRRRDPEEGGR